MPKIVKLLLFVNKLYVELSLERYKMHNQEQNGDGHNILYVPLKF